MPPSLDPANSASRTFSVTVQAHGQITVPSAVQDRLNLTEGAQLTLLQLGDFILLTPKVLQVNDLANQITTLCEASQITVDDLLEDLAEERTILWADNHPHA